MNAPYEHITDKLEAIEEELADVGYERLRSLARDPDADGAANIKAEERALVSARRAVAKARQTLLGIVTND